MDRLQIGWILLAVCGVSFSISVKFCDEGVACIQDLVGAWGSHNLTGICGLMSNGSHCLNAARLGNSECKFFAKTVQLNEYPLSQDVLDKGCDVNCSRTIGVCLNLLANELSNEKVYRPKICKELSESELCLKDIKSDECSRNMTHIIATVFRLEVADASSFNDICEKGGNATDCFKKVYTCFETVNITSAMATNQTCNQAKSYMMCEKRTGRACLEKTNEVGKQVRAVMENNQSMYHCPMAGTCEKRQEKCLKHAKEEEKIIGHNTDNKTEWCNVLTSAVGCLKFVHTDVLCPNDDMFITDDEVKYTKLQEQVCGGAPSLTLSGALVLVAMAVQSIKSHMTS